jgi:hypothetical protein
LRQRQQLLARREPVATAGTHTHARKAAEHDTHTGERQRLVSVQLACSLRRSMHAHEAVAVEPCLPLDLRAAGIRGRSWDECGPADGPRRAGD